MVIIKVENCYSWLITNDEIRHSLWKMLRFREKDYFHNVRYKMKVWDGYKDFLNKDNGRFLTGLLPEVKFALKTMGHEYKIEDCRNAAKFNIETVDKDFLSPKILYDYQIEYINQTIKNRRGVIYAPTSCHAKGQGILMYDGKIKKVEDIFVGNLVMGDDGNKRTVVETHNGITQMYKIIPVKGDSFVVTGDHYLTLESVNERSGNTFAKKKYSLKNGEVISVKYKRKKINGNKRIDVKVVDYLMWSNYKKHIWKLVKSSGIDFANKINKLPLDPYFLGLLLGDGSISTGTPCVTTSDQVIVDYLQTIVDKFGLKLRKTVDDQKCPSYYFTTGIKGAINPITNILRLIGLWGMISGNKSIPQEYLTSSKEQRSLLLAGLIDTDGSVIKNRQFDYSTKSKQLIKDVSFLARSLGFHVSSISECEKSSQNGTVGLYQRVYISGGIELPTKIKHRSLEKRTNSLRSGFKIQSVGLGEYYGFSLKEDPHYLMDDFTVTHNSGKTLMMVGILKALEENTPTLVLANKTSLVDQNYEEIKSFGIKNVGRFYSGIKEANIITCSTIQSAHLLKSMFPKIKCLIIDEIHEMMSKKPKAVYQACKNASIRIGLSATPFKFGEKDVCQKYEVKGYIGPVFSIKSAENKKLTTKELQKRNILSTSECIFRYVNSTPLPYHTYIDAVTDGVAQNEEFHSLNKRLVNSLDGRILLIVERIAHGDRLQELMPDAVWIRGQDNLETRKIVIQRLKEDKGKVVAIATSGIFNTGLNVYCHHLINSAGGTAEHQIIQRFGRGLRKSVDKTHLVYHDWIFKNNDYLEKHSLKRIKIIEKEGHPVKILSEMDV